MVDYLEVSKFSIRFYYKKLSGVRERIGNKKAIIFHSQKQVDQFLNNIENLE